MLRTFWFLLKVGVIMGVLALLSLSYLFYHYSKDLPDYSQLKEYYPPCVTRIYSSDGKLIEEYAKEHRIFVPISSVPRSLIEAFIAAEDKNFYHHPGIDIMSIARASIANISNVLHNRRIEGASTITQQVVKNFLLSSERSIERKIKEAILSYRISQSLSKDQILELYLNQIFLGKGAHGVAAAALAYFNKSVEELTLNESAVLASLPKAPSKFNPEKDYDRAFERKNYVIGRMFEDGYITEEAARKAIAEPIVLAKHDKVLTVDAHYYAEQVREEVINMFGNEYFYTAGLTVITCLDSEKQKHASNALIKGIRDFDKKKGFRAAIKNIGSTENWQKQLSEFELPIGIKNDQLAIVLSVSKINAKIGLKNGAEASLSIKDMAWTRTNLTTIEAILKPGDIIAVTKVENGKYLLSQIPNVNGGIMVMEPFTGRVLAAEGGYDFEASKFNRTTQANRQPGSLIKAFLYLTALENGFKPNDVFDDAPIAVPQGPGMPMWTPKNDDGTFLGPITLRRGLERSRNLVTIRIGLAVGLGKITEVIKKLGINDEPKKVNSLFLGAIETTLERMTNAFTIIASKGHKVTPHYIELIKDRKGNVIYKRDYAECNECKDYKHDVNGEPVAPVVENTESEQIIDEATNYQLTSILQGVILRGTGYLAKPLNKVIAGKTGTTNEAKDTWFIGFTPRIVVGTYVGFDQPKSLGKKVYGSTVATPIFVEFMKNAYQEPSLDFEIPANIRLGPITYETGKISDNGSGNFMEAFKINTPNNAGSQSPSQSSLPEDNNDSLDVFSRVKNIDKSEEVY